MNQAGDVTCKDDVASSGTGAITTANAGNAFMAYGGANTITSTPAIGTVGRDGMFWKQVN